MNKSPTEILFDILQNGSVKDDIPSIQSVAEEMAEIRGITTPFKVEFRNLFFNGPDYSDKDILIVSGNPVIVVFNDRFALQLALERRKVGIVRKRLNEVLDKIPKLHRTLRHPIPLSKAKAYRAEKREWVNISAPVFEDKLVKSDQLEFSYSITVRDKITDTVVTLNGSDPGELKKLAINRLSTLIFSNAELLDLIDQMDEMRKHKIEHPLNEITLGGSDDEHREGRKY